MSKGTKEIRTKRFLLRQIRISDYEDIYKYTSKEEVARYVHGQYTKILMKQKNSAKYGLSNIKTMINITGNCI